MMYRRGLNFRVLTWHQALECSVKARSSDALLDCKQQFDSCTDTQARRPGVRPTGRSRRSVDLITVLSEL